MKLLTPLFCLIVLTALFCSPALADNFIEMEAVRYLYSESPEEYRYVGDVLIGIDAPIGMTVDAVYLSYPGDGWDEDPMDFDSEEGAYYSASPMDLTLEQLYINGEWGMDIVTSDSEGVYHSVYYWTADTEVDITADDFPAPPEITAPTYGASDVDPEHEFLWDMEGEDEYDELWVMLDADGEFYDEDLDPADTSWAPSPALPAGDALFIVSYAWEEYLSVEYDETESIARGAADDGDGDDFIAEWAETSIFLVGGDMVEFTVVPEPASMAALAIGGLALLRRRK